jgi:hypothetical protein
MKIMPARIIVHAFIKRPVASDHYSRLREQTAETIAA